MKSIGLWRRRRQWGNRSKLWRWCGWNIGCIQGTDIFELLSTRSDIEIASDSVGIEPCEQSPVQWDILPASVHGKILLLDIRILDATVSICSCEFFLHTRRDFPENRLLSFFCGFLWKCMMNFPHFGLLCRVQVSVFTFVSVFFPCVNLTSPLFVCRTSLTNTSFTFCSLLISRRFYRIFITVW